MKPMAYKFISLAGFLGCRCKKVHTGAHESFSHTDNSWCGISFYTCRWFTEGSEG
jgi:hypothetical protein